MDPVLNPLYDSSSEPGLMSPQRAVPKPQQQDTTSQPPRQTAAPGCFTRWRRGCCTFTPWTMVVGVAVLVAAQVAWAIYTERFLGAAQQLLAAAGVVPPAGLAHSLTIAKAVLVGVTSFLGAVMLGLGVVVKKQRLAKRAAPSRADWPHGCKSYATMVLAVGLSLVLWLAAAAFVGLLCCTFTATGVALAGDVAAGQAISLANSVKLPTAGPRVQELGASMRRARTAMVAAANAAPPFIKRSPWFEAMNSSVMPLLTAEGNSSSTEQSAQAEEESMCPPTCLNLRLVTVLLHHDNSPTAGCVCVKEGLQQAQGLLKGMWKDGVAAMACVAGLAAIATWLLVYCLVACITTWRDHAEAKHCRHLAADQQQNGNVSGWMWTAGVTSPHSASDTLSSFPAFELPLDTHRPPQLTAPELAGSAASPSPRKQAKWGTGAGHADQQERQNGADNQVHDVECPARTPPDQLSSPLRAHAPSHLQPRNPGSPHHHSIQVVPDSPSRRHHPDQLQLPTATPVAAMNGSSSRPQHGPSGARGSSSSSNRRRGHDSLSLRR